MAASLTRASSRDRSLTAAVTALTGASRALGTAAPDSRRAEAAVARINLDKAPSRATLDQLRAGNEDIIELNVLEIV